MERAKRLELSTLSLGSDGVNVSDGSSPSQRFVNVQDFEGAKFQPSHVVARSTKNFPASFLPQHHADDAHDCTLTVGEAAVILQMSVDRVYQLCGQDRLANHIGTAHGWGDALMFDAVCDALDQNVADNCPGTTDVCKALYSAP